MEAIRFNNVTKSFGSLTALNESTLSVEKGQIFGFLGPNGAGKTTSIRCLMDFIHPDNGSIRVLGMDAHHDSVELKSRIGYLPTANHLHPEWTGQRHIDLVASIRGNAKSPNYLASRLDLDPSITVKNLSTGNRQKLAILLAFTGRPELIVMDEPTQGLDPILQNQFCEIVKQYQEFGGTVFMSSHNLVEIEHLCKSVAIINKGRIVIEDTMENLREKSSHRISVNFKPSESKKFVAIPGIDTINQTSHSVVMKVKGDLNRVIAELGKYAISDLEIMPPNLDEIFLEYYHV